MWLFFSGNQGNKDSKMTRSIEILGKREHRKSRYLEGQGKWSFRAKQGSWYLGEEGVDELHKRKKKASE